MKYVSFVHLTFVICAASFAPENALSQDARAILLEACNGISSSSKRLECFKAATAKFPSSPASSPSPAQTSTSTAQPSKESNKQGDALTLAEATELCEGLMRYFRDWKPATEIKRVPERSSSVLTFAWGATEGVDYQCSVDAENKKAIYIKNNLEEKFEGTKLQTMQRRVMREMEIRRGIYGPFVADAKAEIAKLLKDPSSPQFRNLFISSGIIYNLCGEINAKNSYGGYVGFRRFHTNDIGLLQAIEPNPSDYVKYGIFQDTFPDNCSKKVADLPEQ